MTFRIAALGLVAACLVLSVACDGRVTPAQDIERQILAPCCYRQTLEDHDSDLARALRAEIEHRIADHEPSSAIVADLVHRYGEHVQALPGGGTMRLIFSGVLGLGIVLGALVLGRFARRARPRGRAPAPASSAQPDDEDRLDAELLEVD